MGIGFDLECDNCGHKIEYLIGNGMLYAPYVLFEGYGDTKPLVESLVRSRKIKDHAYYLLKEKQGELGEYRHELYQCDQCKSVVNRFHFEIKHNEGIYEPVYYCSKCRKPLQRLKYIEDKQGPGAATLDGTRVDLKCPKCSVGTMKFATFILWD